MAVYTSINDSSAQFQTLLWTGDGNATRALTNTGNANLQPDWVWLKNRTDAENHTLADTSRGITKRVSSNNDAAEDSNGLVSVQSDGFTVSQSNNGNTNAKNYVAWQWKVNGGTTASNSSGTTTVNTQVNSTAGVSIITGNGSSSAGQTFGHGLSQAPEFFTFRMKDATADWITYHKNVGPGSYLRLNQDVSPVSNTNIFSNTDPSSTLIYYGGNSMFNSNAPFFCYAFHSVQGFSKIGKYRGNGNSDGTFVYTGFKPAFTIIKRYTDSSEAWILQDNKRSPFNPSDVFLTAGSGAESQTTNAHIDYLSNGFKLRHSDTRGNTSAKEYLYLAFADNPFTSSAGIPTTAR